MVSRAERMDTVMKRLRSTIVDNPRIRIPTIDAGRLGNTGTGMVGLLEIDITCLREKIRKLRGQNIMFSFTACMIKLIGDCIAENKVVQAGLINERKMVLFDDVDFSISIERSIGDKSFPFPWIVRSVNRKSVLEIDDEIRRESGRKVSDENDLFMPKRPGIGKALLDAFYGIPSIVRVRIMEFMIKNPFRARSLLGTVGFATVAMTGRLSGWVFPTKNPYSVYFSLGSVGKKPLVVGNEVKIREILNMAVIFNHNVIDGAPARRFMNELVGRIERAKIDLNEERE